MVAVSLSLRLKLTLLVIMSLGLVALLVNTLNFKTTFQQKSPLTTNQTQQAPIDCAVKKSNELIAEAQRQDPPEECLFVGCSGLYQ